MLDICMGGWVVEGERRRGERMMVVSRREGGAGRRWRERCGVKRLCGVYCQGRENLSGVVLLTSRDLGITKRGIIYIY